MPDNRDTPAAARYSLVTTGLRRYFYSGWAFLIPYLAVYLLYYVTGWPVNAAAGAAAGEGLEAIGQGSTHYLSPTTYHLVPCLLHVYWALHAIHLILAGLALWSWWSSYRSKDQGPCTKCQEATPTVASPPHGLWPITLRLLPWILLALLFYIPGIYLEWPSDPWEHLYRINTWGTTLKVDDQPFWHKSSYFLIFSFVGKIPSTCQLSFLNLLYTANCLLLCWQYYRFSRACGLGERASMIFVIVQALLFGNNIFSFYRYYGISSSIYAQLGAVALTRIVLEFVSRGTKLDPASQQISKGTEDAITPLALEPGSVAPLTTYPLNLKPHLLPLITAVTCLTALTAFNHPQGLGIAALGILAILIWRLIEWKRSALWWLVGGTLVINALFLWLYQRPTIVETYRAQGYLNAWYGFNILDLSSPAGDRMLQIVSSLGLVNGAAAFCLLRRNHIIGWLTLTSTLVLLWPLVSIPFAAALGRHDVSGIVTFQRMLFAVPQGLALVGLAVFLRICGRITALRMKLSFKKTYNAALTYIRVNRLEAFGALSLTCLSIVAVLTTPSTKTSYNRTWHTLSKIPDDLCLKPIISDHSKNSMMNDTTLVATTGFSWAKMIQYPTQTFFWQRVGRIPSDDLTIIQYRVSLESERAVFMILANPKIAITPFSFAARCSSHWTAQEVPLAFSGQKELLNIGLAAGLKSETPHAENLPAIFFIFKDERLRPDVKCPQNGQ